MSDPHVALQGTETRWEALRRIVKQEADEAFGLSQEPSPDYDSGERPLLAAEEQYNALARVLHYMDKLEHQQRTENEQ